MKDIRNEFRIYFVMLFAGDEQMPSTDGVRGDSVAVHHPGCLQLDCHCSATERNAKLWPWMDQCFRPGVEVFLRSHKLLYISFIFFLYFLLDCRAHLRINSISA